MTGALAMTKAASLNRVTDAMQDLSVNEINRVYDFVIGLSKPKYNKNISDEEAAAAFYGAREDAKRAGVQGWTEEQIDDFIASVRAGKED